MTTLQAPVYTEANSQIRYHQIVIVGGGAAGTTVAAQLLNSNKKLDIAIIEPSENHYYQPGWTLVGGGVFKI
ncbi:MAG: FAD/NAD(P)-binding oxidoreductase, partial [Leptolyngbyaceae cyanobacterium MO_188.B28]|nr:FAD/NAD(P)-binding oxidoreductase [Leptolyngbyaceae cyanobacterium MO_188.B28]